MNSYAEKLYIEYDPVKVSWEEIRRLVEVSTSEFDYAKLVSIDNSLS